MAEGLRCLGLLGAGPPADQGAIEARMGELGAGIGALLAQTGPPGLVEGRAGGGRGPRPPRLGSRRRVRCTARDLDLRADDVQSADGGLHHPLGGSHLVGVWNQRSLACRLCGPGRTVRTPVGLRWGPTLRQLGTGIGRRARWDEAPSHGAEHLWKLHRPHGCAAPTQRRQVRGELPYLFEDGRPLVGRLGRPLGPSPLWSHDVGDHR